MVSLQSPSVKIYVAAKENNRFWHKILAKFWSSPLLSLIVVSISAVAAHPHRPFLFKSTRSSITYHLLLLPVLGPSVFFPVPQKTLEYYRSLLLRFVYIDALMRSLYHGTQTLQISSALLQDRKNIFFFVLYKFPQILYQISWIFVRHGREIRHISWLLRTNHGLQFFFYMVLFLLISVFY